MNFSNGNPLNSFEADDGQEQIIEKKANYYNKSKEFSKVELVHDALQNPKIFNCMDQIQNLYFQGQYSQNGMKHGNWIASLDSECLKNFGGYYQEGEKQGLWKDLFFTYCSQAQVFETGEYLNNLRIGNWNYIFCDKKFGGGQYKDGIKQGKWIELDENFSMLSQVTYNGEYSMKCMKVGKWDISFCDSWNTINKQIGGGQYGEGDKGQIKIGRWVELCEGFSQDAQITYNGEYNMNGIKVGKWDILNLQLENQFCGCINFDENGNEIYRTDKKGIIYVGQFQGRMKVGRWNIMYNEDRDQNTYGIGEGEYILIGGGSYGEGDQVQIKIGRWIELDEKFSVGKQVTYDGEYNLQGMKVGKWDIISNGDKIGGGLYGELDKIQIKIGRWVELWERYNDYAQVIFAGDYNDRGMKQGRWDLVQNEEEMSQFSDSGGGSYGERDKSQIKIWRWLELDEGFYACKQVTYNGEYNMQGMKVGKWDSVYMGEEIGGGIYDKGENGLIKIGRWVELDDSFRNMKRVTYNGEYNIKGMKVGRWDICFCRREKDGYKQIGGGTYGDGDKDQIKIGRWAELWEGFSQDAQVTYIGEYNMKGMKVGRWDIVFEGDEMFVIQNVSGGGSYGDGDQCQFKTGSWVELDEMFLWKYNETVYNGEYNMKGMKIGIWIKMDIRMNQKIGEKSYDNWQNK